ncbi:MAG: PAS domain S-box protein, partial [Chroococcales cyanobacterium]
MKALKFLLLEDSLLDAELIQAHLEEGNINCDLVRVETRTDFQNALLNTIFDLILADYSLPSFDGIAALEIAQSCCPEIPFIFVSATLGEEVAIETLKSGATDYVLKQRLGRLAPSVQRAIRESQERQERQEAEEKLYRREQEFQALVENSPDIIARFDKEFRHIYVNPAIEKATGIPPETFIGKTNFELGISTEKCLFWQGVLEKIFATGQEQIIEFDFPYPDGIQHYHHSRLVPEFAADGSVEFILAISRDITELKRAEAALRESELRYATLAETVPIIIFTCDAQGKNDYCNQRWYDYTGLTVEESEGFNWSQALHPEDVEKTLAIWEQGLQTGMLS